MSTTLTPNGGGAILVLGSSLQIEGSTFELNISSSNGGAVVAGAGTDTIVETTTFRNNSALGLGGGIYQPGSSLRVGAAVLKVTTPRQMVVELRLTAPATTM